MNTMSENAVVTRLIVTAVGNQQPTITTTANGLDQASLQLTLPSLIIQFTSCEQVQHLRGLLAFAGPATMGMGQHHHVPLDNFDVQMRNTITILKPQAGTVTRELISGRMPYIVIHWGPLTWRILDRTAYESLTETLERTHKTAATVFPDGHRHRTDPTRPNWLSNTRNTHQMNSKWAIK